MTNALGVEGTDHQHHADAKVEYLVHLRLVDLAETLDPGEHRRYRPTAAIDDDLGTIGHDPGKVLAQAAARDVRDAVDHVLHLVVGQHAADRADVEPRGRKHRLAYRLAQLLDAIGCLMAGDLEDDLAGEAVAVGVQAGRGQPEHDVAGDNRRAVNDVPSLDHADAEARQVVIARCVEVPVTVDADTGYGNALNAMRATREFEAAGLAGMMIEDQVFPKRCGHFEGKKVIPAEEMVIKVQAVCEARRNDNFVIIARTDARAVYSIDEAIRRALMYCEAGADMIFVESMMNVEEMRKAAKAIPRPLKANMNDGGKTPPVHYNELHEMGYKLINYSGMLQRTAIRAMTDVVEILKREGTTASAYPEKICDMTERSELLGLSQFYELEERLYGKFLETEGSWRKELDERSAARKSESRKIPI